MRILYIDIDTLRADHLGCYGYHRRTSPNIDGVAAEGIRFENCYVSDAPCLPSRSSLFTGRFGVHTGVVNHGGTQADPRRLGPQRQFRADDAHLGWAEALCAAGWYTVSVSPYAERHAAWWFYAGFREMYNPGKGGREQAHEVFPYAIDWLKRNAERDKWFLHVNFWDPHTPYRVPAEYGNPFENEPAPSWITQKKIEADLSSYGPHAAAVPPGCYLKGKCPRMPAQIADLHDYKKHIDGYDTGILYADDYVGRILEFLDEKNLLDDTAVIVSADHGENQGELNVYADHQTADHITSRVPCILRWPGVTDPGVDCGLHYQTDIGASVLELGGCEVPPLWDGQSFAEGIRQKQECARQYLVLSQCAWSCQRAVRFGDWMFIRTYDTGLKPYPRHMLFDVARDPHELNDLAGERPEVVQRAGTMLGEWHDEMMAVSESDSDPLWEVMREGGPFHTRAAFREDFARHYEEVGRPHEAELMRTLTGKPIDED